MDIFTILAMLGGLAMFIYGMQQMSAGLEKASGGRLERMLEKITTNKYMGLMLGIGITAIIQSSSATTVTVVGLVNSGVMQLEQAISVIMGANVGTTVTAWLLSLAGIESGNFWIQLLKPSSFTPVLAVIGCVMMFSKQTKRKDIGGILLGFAVLMFGMETMSGAIKPLASEPGFQNVLTMFKNPFLGVMVGMLLTAIIQSSSVSVGMLQAVALTGGLTYGAAIPIIMGQNIGTCVTALISAIGANRNAKRVAIVHLYFNVIGTIVFMTLYFVLRYGAALVVFDAPIGAAGVAVMHSAFNILSTALLLPFTRQLEKLSMLTLREPAVPEAQVLIDERLLATPSLAVSRCKEVVSDMAGRASDMLMSSIALIDGYDPAEAARINAAEDEVDRYEDVLGTFLIKVGKRSLSDEESMEAAKILHGIGDLERIADHAVNIVEAAEEIEEKKISFTQDARRELQILTGAVVEVLSTAVASFKTYDVELAKRVEPLEEVIDDLTRELRARHIERLQEGRCTAQAGFVFADILSNYERVADHSSNLALSVIELSHSSYNTHAYQMEVGADEGYVRLHSEMAAKYAL